MLPIWTTHHTFVESKHPEVAKKLMLCFVPRGEQKETAPTHGLYVTIQTYP